MRKVILMLLLAGVSSNAMAEWVNLGNNDVTTAYANPDTIKRLGNTVKMWCMFDLKKPQDAEGKIYLSAIDLYEFDCKEETSRLLALNVYAQNMGKGEVVFSSSKAGESFQNPPDSVGESLFKYACRKR